MKLIFSWFTLCIHGITVYDDMIIALHIITALWTMGRCHASIATFSQGLTVPGPGPIASPDTFSIHSSDESETLCQLIFTHIKPSERLS